MIVDTHTHWPMNNSPKPFEFIKLLNRYGIDRALVSGWEVLFKIGESCQWNDRLAEFCTASEGVLFPLATVHLSEGQKAVDEALRCVNKLKVRGFKVHPWLQGESFFRTEMDELCRIAGEANVPLLFHDGTPPYALPSQIGVLANKFQKTTFILGHGGILHYWQEALNTAKMVKNIVISLCGQHPLAMQNICEQMESERIIFGTDCLGPGSDDIVAYRKGLVERLNLSKSVREHIMFKNAVRIFKL